MADWWLLVANSWLIDGWLMVDRWLSHGYFGEGNARPLLCWYYFHEIRAGVGVTPFLYMTPGCVLPGSGLELGLSWGEFLACKKGRGERWPNLMGLFPWIRLRNGRGPCNQSINQTINGVQTTVSKRFWKCIWASKVGFWRRLGHYVRV